MSHLPPPNPDDAWTDTPELSGPSAGQQAALYSDSIINWVNRRSWWATAVLWIVGYIVLLPLLIVGKTRGSRNGMIGAAALFFVFLIIGATNQPTAGARGDRGGRRRG